VASYDATSDCPFDYFFKSHPFTCGTSHGRKSEHLKDGRRIVANPTSLVIYKRLRYTSDLEPKTIVAGTE
jgi:hypothetical protein